MGNPVRLIDPDGRDWYIDIDRTYQYSPNVHSQKDLEKGQTYLWSSWNDTKAGIYYRSDGSMIYKNETAAYNRMWNQADKHYLNHKGGRETGGFVLSDGRVLILPEYLNNSTTSHIDKYGYKLSKNGFITKGKERYKVLANIHTHQNQAYNATPSYYPMSESDLGVSKNMGGLPVLTIGHDNLIHGILYNKDGKREHFDLYSRDLLLEGSYSIYPWLKKTF